MNDLKDILETLRTLGSAERVAKSRTMYPTSMEVIGVMNPDLKIVVKELHILMKAAPRERFIRLAEELVNTKIIECQMLAWLLLDKANLISGISRQELKRLEGVLDNWVSVDTYGTMVYGVLWRLGTLSDDEVFSLQESQNFWYRRLALVATVALNLRSRGGRGDTSRTIAICERAVGDKHDMIVKALSWALRSLILWDREAVSLFLDRHRQQLPGRVLKEVSHKLEFGTKN